MKYTYGEDILTEFGFGRRSGKESMATLSFGLGDRDFGLCDDIEAER